MPLLARIRTLSSWWSQAAARAVANRVQHRDRPLWGAAALAFSSQGVDPLRSLTETTADPLPKITFLLATLSWALAAWYCGRVLVTKHFPNEAVGEGEGEGRSQRALRIWVPRCLGTIAIAAVALGSSAPARRRHEACPGARPATRGAGSGQIG